MSAEVIILYGSFINVSCRNTARSIPPFWRRPPRHAMDGLPFLLDNRALPKRTPPHPAHRHSRAQLAGQTSY